jgi:dTDP-4-dehydrorhamnose reductase
MKTLLISGGHGLLAKQIIKHNTKYQIFSPSKAEMDVSDYSSIENCIIRCSPDIFLHAGAYTRPMQNHVEHPDISIKNNIIGTSNVVLACMEHKIKLVYISTDYVYPRTLGSYREDDPVNPFTSYGWSKLGGECAVRLYENSLILRSCISNYPFPHLNAFTDVTKSMIYNTEASKIILELLEEYGIVNVGGKIQTVYEFAKELNPNIGKISISDLADDVESVGKDTSMCIDKMNGVLKNK